ncbi:MAG: ribonuclease HI family protein [Duganella sp.]
MNHQPTWEDLASAAYHGERVAARRLVRRTQVTEQQALHNVLEQAAGQDGLAALLAARELERQRESARRSASKAAQAQRLALRTAARSVPTGGWRGWFDGSAHPNPGRIGIGALLCGPDGERVEISRLAGYGNSGEAEYLALTALLEAAGTAGARDLLVYGDSQVVINDVNSKQQAAGLQAHRARVAACMAGLGTVRLCWVPRHRNSEADRLSQQAIAGASAEAPSTY